jgi:hypothetical protein
MTVDGSSDFERRMSPLAALAREIRGRIWALFEPRAVNFSPESYQASASCEVIRQTDHCLTAFLSREPETSAGERYLAVYGVLQALFVQQDAVRHLFEALGRNYPLSTTMNSRPFDICGTQRLAIRRNRSGVCLRLLRTTSSRLSLSPTGSL